jgi:hypothetical protein
MVSAVMPMQNTGIHSINKESTMSRSNNTPNASLHEVLLDFLAAYALGH